MNLKPEVFQHRDLFKTAIAALKTFRDKKKYTGAKWSDERRAGHI